MIIRELDREEFYKLDGHPILQGQSIWNADRIVIAESEDGQIRGFWCVVLVPHLEPVWIHPDERGTTLLGRMWHGVLQLLDALHINTALSCADRPEIEGYLERLGFTQLPYSTFLHTKDSKIRCLFP